MPLLDVVLPTFLTHTPEMPNAPCCDLQTGASHYNGKPAHSIEIEESM